MQFWSSLGVGGLDGPSKTSPSATVEPILSWLSSDLAPRISVVPDLIF